MRFVYRNLDEISVKFLWLFMDATGRWLAEQIKMIDKQEIRQFWEREQLLTQIERLMSGDQT